MTVRELKEKLNNFDDNLPVCIPTKIDDNICLFFDYASADDLSLINTQETGPAVCLENISSKDSGGSSNGF